MRTPEPSPNCVITAKVPEAVVRRLRAVARREDRTISWAVRRILRDWADQQPEDSVIDAATR